MTVKRFNNTMSIAKLALFVALAATIAVPAIAEVTPTPVPTTVPDPLSLQQAITIALQHQPNQYAAQAQQTEAAGTVMQAKSQYFPTVTPTYTYEADSNAAYSPAAGELARLPAGSVPTSGSMVTIDASELLFDNGKRELANAQARRTNDIANDDARNTTETTIDAVTEDYYNLLMATDLVKVGQSQVDSAQIELNLVQAQVTAGTVAASSTYQAQATLANAQVTLIQDQTSVSNAAAALKAELGVGPAATIDLVPLAPGDALPPPPAPGPATTLAQYLQTAYDNRPDLQAQQAMVGYQEIGVKQAQLNAGLQFAGTAYYLSTDQNSFGSTSSDERFMLTATWPILDFGYYRGAVVTAEGMADSAKDSYDSLKLSVNQAVEQAYVSRNQAESAATLAQAALKAAQVNYDSTVAMQKEGLATVVDVTTAQVTLVQAQDQYVTAIYNYYIEDSALSRAIGQNDINPTGAAAPQ